MTHELTYPALDAAHAVVIAAYDATRFHAEPDLGGLVGRLRRTAIAAKDATLRGCKALADAGRVDELLRADDLLRQLADCAESAHRGGLDLAAAAELLEYQTYATLTLAALLEDLQGRTALAA